MVDSVVSSIPLEADFPILSDPTKQVATAYGVLNQRGIANRWTFYIGKDGKILAIDKAVRPETSAEDMAAKLKELGVATNSF
jgi:peroxiredoxin Q/BCP